MWVSGYLSEINGRKSRKLCHDHVNLQRQLFLILNAIINWLFKVIELVTILAGQQKVDELQFISLFPARRAIQPSKNNALEHPPSNLHLMHSGKANVLNTNTS